MLEKGPDMEKSLTWKVGSIMERVRVKVLEESHDAEERNEEWVVWAL